jgi:anaerobic selenocysteine-containing dehydrogenase
MKTLANLVVLLRGAGVEAEILLPRIIANSAALEILGADPAFTPGRKPVAAGEAGSKPLPGARTLQELHDLLEKGEIRAALVLGEDPMAWGRTGSWFQNVEFMATMDWTPTETTSYSDVVLPGCTYLEQGGTRCNFEGNLVEFRQAVESPAGRSGMDVLRGLAGAFGVSTPADLGALSTQVSSVARAGLIRSGRTSDVAFALVPAEAEARPVRVAPPLTHTERYKREIREVGTERFRVR